MVIEQGNTMFFVNKAKEFMRSIERVEKQKKHNRELSRFLMEIMGKNRL